MKLNIVPARTGLTWVRLGISTFFKQPLALAGLFFLYMAAMFLLAQAPLIGAAVAAVFVPASTLGIMVAVKEATTGKFPMPTLLLSAFRAGRKRARAMLLLGVVYAIGWFLGLALADVLAPAPPPQEVTTAAGQAQLAWFYLAVTLLSLPLNLLFWHAPALVHWHDVPPLKSMFFSLVACLRNLGAFAVFALTWLSIFMIALFVLALVGVAFGGPAMMTRVLVPAFLLLLAMFSTSIYFSFRDSFVADEQPPESPDDTAHPARP
jgi:hypothetical protein